MIKNINIDFVNFRNPNYPFQSEKTKKNKAQITQSKVYQENMAGMQSLFAMIIIFIFIVLLVFQYRLI